MTTPSPFEIGRQTSQNIRKGLSQYREGSKIDAILSQAQESGDPKQIQNMMNQIITTVSPEQRPVVEKALQTRHNQLMNIKTQTEMSSIADRIELNNPNSKPHKMLADIYRSNMTTKDKNEMAKSLANIDPFKFDQQARLKQNSLVNNYGKLIKEVDKELDNLNINEKGGKEKEARLMKRKKRLQTERDAVLDFEALKKPVFDPKNPEHMAKFEEFDIKFKGNKVKVNEAMSEEFRL